MAAPSFDSNTWYSLQSLGTKFYLDCNSISICGAGTDSLTNFEWFQLNKANASTPLYIRPKARDVDENGQPFCINLNTGEPFLSQCTNASATWGTGYWNGRDAGDGLFFYSTERPSTQRLSLDQNGVWSLPDYNGLSASSLDQMRWAVSSLAAINNQSYSTMPAVITLSTTALAAAMSTSSSGITASTLSGVSSISDSRSTIRQPSSSSIAATSAQSATGSTSTRVVTDTPTVTASTSPISSGQSTASTATPTVRSNTAHKSGPNVRDLTVLSMAVIALQGGAWLI